MPRLIKDGAIVDSDWLPANPERLTPGHILSLDQWLALDDKSGSVVQLEPGDGVTPLLDHLDDIDLVAVNFPAFTDGRIYKYEPDIDEFTGYDLPTGARRLIQRATGYHMTIKSGTPIMENGQETGALPGGLIRGPQSV